MTVDDAKEVRQGRHWQLVCDEIDKRINDLKDTIITTPPDKLVEVQRKLKSLAEFKSLPEDVISRGSE